MKTSNPDKRVRLALWWLVYRVPIHVNIQTDSPWRMEAREHLKLDQDGLSGVEVTYPRHWARMLAKRARRADYARKHDGYCPNGWTPPLPGEPVRNPPWAALAKRHLFGFMGVASEYREARMLNFMEKSNRLSAREAVSGVTSQTSPDGRKGSARKRGHRTS